MLQGGLQVRRKKENESQALHAFNAPESKLGLDKLAAIKRKEKEQEVKSPSSKRAKKTNDNPDHEAGRCIAHAREGSSGREAAAPDSREAVVERQADREIKGNAEVRVGSEAGRDRA